MICKVWLQGCTLIWIDLGRRVREIEVLRITKSKMAPFLPLNSFHISPGTLIYLLPVILLEEEKTKARHSCFQILQGWSCEEGADFLCANPGGRVRAKSRSCCEAESCHKERAHQGCSAMLSWEEVILPHLWLRWQSFRGNEGLWRQGGKADDL